ncbi:hypothetical protein [Hyphomicrobium sp.]|uniref:hypothetical protein n=1 Tax=Hyphomicrobium sp. TaxID=82 RepID=UPI000F914B72|nr:hypothetical protein [Hyphomicrobium sp.]RUO98948.1 MAG: hypothetical protein EKK30_08830 [Hyphomicrobium sp.]
MRHFRTVCTELECIRVSIGGEIDADPAHSIVIEFRSANNVTDEALGPDVSCEFHVDPDTARRFSALLFAAYIAAAAGNPRSELMDQNDDRDFGLFLDAGVMADGKIHVTFELLQSPSHGSLPSLIWAVKLEAAAVAELSEALLSASKIAAEERVSPTSQHERESPQDAR